MRTCRADREAGFTLLELLAVLVIMALSASAVLYAGQSSADSSRVRSFLLNAQSLFREARTEAIESGTATDVVIDTRARRISLPASGRVVQVPPSVALDAGVAVLEGAEGPAVRFFPSGGSSGGRLSFSFKGRSYALSINWLTGRADVQAN